MSTDSRITPHVPARVTALASTVRDVAVLGADRNLPYLAAGIAFYALVSIIPLILLAVAVASFLGGDALAARVTGILGDQLSSAGQESLTGALTDSAGRGTASVVGVVGLAWGGLKLFRGLDQAFDELYLDGVETGLPEQLRNGAVVVVGLALAVGLVVAVGVALSFLPPEVPFVQLLGTLLLVGVLGLALVPMYYVLSPVDQSIRAVAPGAAVAACGWVVLQFGFKIYAANAGQYGAYGMIGAVLLFVMWLNFASTIVLVGGAVNATLHEERPSTGTHSE